MQASEVIIIIGGTITAVVDVRQGPRLRTKDGLELFTFLSTVAVVVGNRLTLEDLRAHENDLACEAAPGNIFRPNYWSSCSKMGWLRVTQANWWSTVQAQPVLNLMNTASLNNKGNLIFYLPSFTFLIYDITM